MKSPGRARWHWSIALVSFIWDMNLDIKRVLWFIHAVICHYSTRYDIGKKIAHLRFMRMTRPVVCVGFVCLVAAVCSAKHFLQCCGRWSSHRSSLMVSTAWNANMVKFNQNWPARFYFECNFRWEHHIENSFLSLVLKVNDFMIIWKIQLNILNFGNLVSLKKYCLYALWAF